MMPTSILNPPSLTRLEEVWYGKSLWTLALLPASGLFHALVTLRRACYRAGLIKPQQVAVPVIVVGNITVGGTGKTPLVIWLVEYLKSEGYRPGIVSRGYGGAARNWPQQVRKDSDPRMVGDEPVLLAQRCQCPIAVGPDRVAAARAILEYTDCDIIVSDDGLQHYALQRDIEIAVIDGVRRLGNGHCLPAGPLREPPKRLESVDLVVVNGIAGRGEIGMQLQAGMLCNLASPQLTRDVVDFRGARVHGVAGIGNPRRFFDTLRRLGMEVIEHPYPDHHPYTRDDICFDDGLPVIMTEKDAVKCRRFVTDRHWMLPVTAKPDHIFENRLKSLLKGNTHG